MLETVSLPVNLLNPGSEDDGSDRNCKGTGFRHSGGLIDFRFPTSTESDNKTRLLENVTARTDKTRPVQIPGRSFTMCQTHSK